MPAPDARGQIDSPIAAPPPSWRLFTSTHADDPLPEARDGAWNMAIDQALFEHVQNGGSPALRFYRWQPACLSLGRNQPAVVDRDALQARGIDLVRRPTGGMAVLHDRELTYSVVAPVGALGSPRETYHRINEALLAGLHWLGGRARLAEQGSASRRLASCFAEPAAGELLADARKLVGSAQRCEQHALLQHGSILVDGDQSEVADLMPGAAAGGRAIGLRELLGRVPGWEQLVAAFAFGFTVQLGIGLAPAPLPPDLLERAGELRATFASREWTWRV